MARKIEAIMKKKKKKKKIEDKQVIGLGTEWMSLVWGILSLECWKKIQVDASRR